MWGIKATRVHRLNAVSCKIADYGDYGNYRDYRKMGGKKGVEIPPGVDGTISTDDLPPNL